MNPLNFSEALMLLKDQPGFNVARKGWNAHHVLGLQLPDAGSVNSLPYIYMVIGGDAADLQGKRVPWVASHTDMLAEDWFEIDTSSTTNQAGEPTTNHEGTPGRAGADLAA